MAVAVVLTLMLAQDAPAEAGAAAQIERIRKALTEAPAIVVSPATTTEGPVFRVTVQGRKPDQPLWQKPPATAAYVRTFFHSYHHEFLERVTTEQFRAATLNPVGIPVITVVEFLVKHLQAASRRRGEANAKEEVREALEELLACRANPERPGC